MQDKGEEAAAGPYRPGDEMNPSHFPHNQTPLLSTLGISNGGQLVIIFNPDQTGPDHGITLADLTVTIWSDALGSMVWQSGDLASDGDVFASTDAGIGKSGIAYDLDAAQAAELTGIIGSNGGPGALRLGLSAHITGSNGGPDAFFVTTQTSSGGGGGGGGGSVPEAGSILLLGSVLIGLGTLAKKRAA